MKNIIELAQSKGSTATTATGARRYLLAHLPKPHLLGSGKHYARAGRYEVEAWKNARRDKTWYGRAKTLGYSTEVSDQWAWYCAAYADNRQYDNDCTTTLLRSGYGEIVAHNTGDKRVPGSQPLPEMAAYNTAIQLYHDSPLTSFDNISFDNKGRAEGYATHVEIYDFAMDGHAIVVCVRETEGTKYGVKTVSKKYHLVTRMDDGTITASDPLRIQVAKLAKMGLPWGSIVHAAETGKTDHIFKPLREQRAAERKAAESTIVDGYKLLKLVDGQLFSVWDNSPWEIGHARKEAVKGNHTAGLYYYRDLDLALRAAHKNGVFREDDNHHRLVVLKVHTTGKQIEYNNGKWAASQITPVDIIASTL